MQRKTQPPELDEFSRRWFVELAEEMGAVKTRGRSKEDLAQVMEWMARFSAFTHHLARSMTDNEDHAFTATRLVWRKFVHHAIRDAKDAFLIPERRTISEAARDLLRIATRWVTVFHRMPRVWVYHRCQEALQEIEFGEHAAQAMPPDGAYQRAEKRLPLEQVPVEQCPVNQRRLQPKVVPTAQCSGNCRVLFLRWIRFSEEEIGAAVDVPRSTVNRFAERCRQHATSSDQAWQKLNNLLDQHRPRPTPD